ncbi:low temperature requirement protein A [Micromonospora inyonensis]|uniref:Low temperature requirement protein LtrA n=1 Tax=Micromonospora inyonensis TaxID=47866 RepID=A0A1C6RBN4_9ACTN|nr:low temperature requirement protein A [Micromonospora inyonensis]SCL14464.1 Low temperature requirement protein LtrA [Micromonospora inyonensis]
MTPRQGTPLRGGEGPHESTILDLLLDLVFVFALNRIAEEAIHHLTDEQHLVLPGVGEVLLLFLAMWLVWFFAALSASRFDPRCPEIQAVIFCIAFGSVVMGVSAPAAYDGHGGYFVGAYVAIQVGRPLALALFQRRPVHQTLVPPPIPARILCWSVVAAVPWIAGAVAPTGLARGGLWTLGLTIEYVGLVLGWPTPRLGRSRIHDWDLVGEYLADRYRQFFIIALGESILLSGLAFSSNPFGAGRTVAFGCAFITTALLWRIYFYRAGTVLKSAVATATQPARLVAYGFVTHLTMVVGVVATAVGYGLVIDHPYDMANPVWLAAVLGGPALFLAGRARFEYDIFGRVSPARIIGILVLAAMSPILVRLPLLTATVAALAVLLGVAIADAVRAHGRSRESPMPPH